MTLSKFLLAWSDVNLFGVFAKLRPAKDARWSLTRVMLLTAADGAGGALFGWVLSLAVFRQPVGWLPWLLGLWAGCIGLCWAGLTAICWNQRAARLRADPALSTQLPKARYRFFRWCLGFVYFVVLGIITPLAMVVTIENIRGEIAWKRERARLVAAGEKLTFRELLGPEIPAAQNAAAAPLYAPFFDSHHEKPRLARTEEGQDIYTTSLVWPQSNAIARVENTLKLPDSLLPEQPKKGTPSTPAVKLADWSAAFRSVAAKPEGFEVPWAKDLKLPPSASPAQDVLLGTAEAESVLAEMARAAALPRCQFPIHFDDGFETVLRHLSVLKGAERLLQVRCAAHLAAGDNASAFADATNALNVAELLREEPLLISQLVRYAQINIAASTLWQGLAEHRWSDAQLAAFQERLGQIDYLPGLVLAFEGERACGVEGVERLIRGVEFPSALVGDDSVPAIMRPLKSIPRGMLRQNQAALAHYESAMLAGLRRGISNSAPAGLTALVHFDEAKLEKFIPTTYSPYRVIVQMLAPATGRLTEKTARAQTLVKMAIVACALERFHLAHGNFPENLEQLTPQFAAGAPHDPMVNQPFHYQRTDDGWFLLYSVGLNGKDDGGMMSDDKSDKEGKDWSWPVPTRPAYPRLF